VLDEQRCTSGKQMDKVIDCLSLGMSEKKELSTIVFQATGSYSNFKLLLLHVSL